MYRLVIDNAKLKRAIQGSTPYVAKQLGWNKSTLFSKLNGYRKLSVDELNALCEKLRREPLEFVYFERETEEETEKRRWHLNASSGEVRIRQFEIESATKREVETAIS